MDILLLTTPAQHSTSNPDVELNPKRLKRWISELHIMDVQQTEKQLNNAIEILNALELDDMERLKLLEIYSEAFEKILYFYDEIRLRQISSPEVQRKTLAQDIIWLYLGLANGYKIIIKNAHESKHSLHKNSSLVLACYRAMELIIYAVVYAYRVHESAPHLAFLEVNQLYCLAQRDGVLFDTVKSVKDKATPPTTDRLYKQFQLFLVADPFRLNGVDILELYSLIEPYATYCEIHTRPDNNTCSGSYSIDLMQDQQPKLINNSDQFDNSSLVTVFNIESAVTEIKLALDRLNIKELSFSQEQEKKLLTNIVSQMGNAQRRNEPRKSINKNVKVAFGSESVDYFLTDEEYIRDACAVESTDGIQVSFVNEDKNYEFSSWRMLDEGSRGCLLESRNSFENKHIMIGEVIIMVNEDCLEENVSVCIGVIRWKRRVEKNTLKLGIEYLSHDPLPVRCVTVENMHKHSALYFPREEGLKRPASLFISKQLKQSVKSLLMEAKGKTFAVQPGDLLSETSFYAQFQIKLV